MRTERSGARSGLLSVLLALLCFMSSGFALVPATAVADDLSRWHADYGPPKDPPTAWLGERISVDAQGHWCSKDGDPAGCRAGNPGELPGTVDICEGADGTGAADCTAAERKEFELRQLQKWREGDAKELPTFEKINAFATTCVDDGRPFKTCRDEGWNKYPPPVKGPLDWVGGKISEMASNALQEAANYVGKSVVWLLGEFAKVFNSSSTINLAGTGIGSVTGLMTALSAVIATFLLLLQFGKVGISQRGEPAATAVVGLAKWAVISSVYLVATQTALGWSDAVSTWIIDASFDGGGVGSGAGAGDATAAMQRQLGTMFGGLITGGGGGATLGGALITGQGVAASAVAVIIVIGIVCILAIGALWVEILLRQAGIMILVATMPVVLAGQMSDATGEWWPKARNALIALVLVKPVIVLCFAVGFGAMTEGKGVQNVIVGLSIFLLACVAWPAIAKFMTFTTVGAGSSVASGVLSSIGSSAGSMSGGYRPELGGAGAVGGGSAYTRALERDTAQSANSGSNAAAGGSSAGGAARPGARFGSRVAAGVGLGLQVLAAGKDVLESGMGNTAAHAGLDHAVGGGRHVVIPPRRTPGGSSEGPPPAGDQGATVPGPRPTPAPVEQPSPPREG